LRNILFDHVKEITLKGGMEKYNRLVYEIERGMIVDVEELLKRIK